MERANLKCTIATRLKLCEMELHRKGSLLQNMIEEREEQRLRMRLRFCICLLAGFVLGLAMAAGCA